MGGRLIASWEKEFVVNNYKTMTDKELGKHLGRMEKSVSVMRYKLGCLRSFPHRRYTKKEKEFIINNFQSMLNIDMANHLKRSDTSISCFLLNNKLKRTYNKKISRTKIVDRKVKRMRELIEIYEKTESPYTKDKCVIDLKKLSELN